MEKELELLFSQTRRKKRVEEELAGLRRREKELREREESLRAERERLSGENQGAASGQPKKSDNERILDFFEGLGDPADSRMKEKEKKEMELLAKEKVTATDLEDAKKLIAQYEAEEKSLEGCEERYQRSKEAELQRRIQAGKEGEELLELETRLVSLLDFQKELQEAMEAGNLALEAEREVKESLNVALNWNSFDTAGGSMISGVVKRSHMEKSQKLIEKLQIRMGRFRMKVEDAKVQKVVAVEAVVNVAGTEQYVDTFFDGFFEGWEFRERVEHACRELDKIRRGIEEVIGTLRNLKISALEKENSLREQIGKKGSYAAG